MSIERALALPAPAKLNWFLHVLGRRADGYHELQTLYALIDLADWIDVERRDDGAVRRHGDLLGTVEEDLALRAAQRLKQASGTHFGADITVNKRIPAGSGLGGGSSDAATTLIALNRLWNLHWPRSRLSSVALNLGADVPFFLHGGNAIAEGIGEQLTAIELPLYWYALIWPQVHVPTREIFADPGLTRNGKALKIADFSAAAAGEVGSAPRLPGCNELEAVARRRFPEVNLALQHLERHGAARMTGSGSAVFLPVMNEDQARAAIADVPRRWKAWAVRGMAEHPLAAWKTEDALESGQ